MMKNIKPNLYSIFFSLSWRIAIPLVLLVAVGRVFDIMFKLENNQFMLSGVVLSLATTIWGIRYTLKQSKVR